MNLRVFSGGGDFAYAEISSRSLPYHNRLFVPLIPPSALQDLDESTTIPVYFEGKRYLACFLLVSNLNVQQHNLKPVGILEEEDSRNILNHHLDNLAYRD